MDSDKKYPSVNKFIRKIFVIVLKILMNLLTRLHVIGVEHVPESGPLIVAGNHTSYWDAPLAGPTMPRMAYILIAEKYQDHVFGGFTRVAGAIFIKRGEADRGALRQIFALLEDDLAVVMAMEGTRSETGGLQEGKDGVAYAALKTNAQIVPLVLWGTKEILPAWKKFRRADVYVRYGEPFHLPSGRVNKAHLALCTEQIMVALANILPEEYRGVYRDHPDVKLFSLD